MSEHTEQAAVIEWVLYNETRFPELRLLHAIPNGAALSASTNRKGQRFSHQAQKLLNEGLKPGVPDLCLPVARGGYFGLYIEMKIKPNKPSPEQKDFMQALVSEGYKAVVCWSAEEAIQTLNAYLALRKTMTIGIDFAKEGTDHTVTYAPDSLDDARVE